MKLITPQFDGDAIRLLKKETLGWHEYATFMRKLGFVPHRYDNKVCVTPACDAPFPEDCFTSIDSGSIGRLYRLHAEHMIDWAVKTDVANHRIQMTRTFWRRNERLEGYFRRASQTGVSKRGRKQK